MYGVQQGMPSMLTLCPISQTHWVAQPRGLRTTEEVRNSEKHPAEGPDVDMGPFRWVSKQERRPCLMQVCTERVEYVVRC